MLGYIVQIVSRLKFGDLFPLRVNDTDVALIEAHLVTAINHPHIVAIHSIDIAYD
ncbi:hypothetical protein ES703_113941 [subsurface metagenome]